MLFSLKSSFCSSLGIVAICAAAPIASDASYFLPHLAHRHVSVSVSYRSGPLAFSLDSYGCRGRPFTCWLSNFCFSFSFPVGCVASICCLLPFSFPSAVVPCFLHFLVVFLLASSSPLFLLLFCGRCFEWECFAECLHTRTAGALVGRLALLRFVGILGICSRMSPFWGTC